MPSLGRHPNDSPFRVVRHRDEVVGVAEDGTRIALSDEDITMLAVDRHALVAAIGVALGIRSEPQDVDLTGSEWLAGTFERLGVRYPVYLLTESDGEDFLAALNRVRLSQASPFVVLTPTSRHLGRALKDQLSSKRACVLALTDNIVAMADGTLLPTRHPDQILTAAADTTEGRQPRPNGVYPPNHIVFAGREFVCHMTKGQVAFLQIGLCNDEVQVTDLMHPKDGVVWKARYINEKSCNDKLHQFCTRLSNALSIAQTGVSFSFNSGTGYIARRDPIWATDHPLTKD